MSVPQRIKDLANKVRNEIYGRDVRESIAQSMEVTGETAEDAKGVAEDAHEITQNLLDDSFDTSKINQNFEQRLDDEIQQLQPELTNHLNSVDQQLAQIAINVKNPPIPLIGVELDGQTDDTETFQNIMEYVSSNGGGKVFIPKGTLIHTINHIPSNVTLEGAGMGVTTIKLKDNALEGAIVRQAFGLYTKWDVDYFEVMNLTYDGNALNNIDLNSADDYDLLSAHGICNGYTDPTIDSYQQTDDPQGKRYAKDFYIDNIHIKNTIRNGLLLCGQYNQRGNVGTVIIEDAYLDHAIYESYTNGRFTYGNVTIKGTWRGAAMVLETGVYDNILVTDVVENPSPFYKLNSLISHRNRNHPLSNRANIKQISADIPLNNMESIIISNNTNGFDIGTMKINQTDPEIQQIISAIPTSVLNGMDITNCNFDSLELNNIKYLNLAYLRGQTHGVVFKKVTIEYASQRVKIDNSYPDALIYVPNSGAITGVRVEDVYIPAQAPWLLSLRQSAPATDVPLDVTFKNIRAITDLSTQHIMNLLNFGESFDMSVKLEEANLQGYANPPRSFRDDYNVTFKNVVVNDLYSDIDVLVFGSVGGTTFTTPVKYLMTPRFVWGNIPPNKTSFSGHEMTVEFTEPLASYLEQYVRVSTS